MSRVIADHQQIESPEASELRSQLTLMARQADRANLSLPTGFFKGFRGAARSADLAPFALVLDVILGRHVDVIGFQLFHQGIQLLPGLAGAAGFQLNRNDAFCRRGPRLRTASRMPSAWPHQLR